MRAPRQTFGTTCKHVLKDVLHGINAGHAVRHGARPAALRSAAPVRRSA